jgi:hypothetical protein
MEHFIHDLDKSNFFYHELTTMSYSCFGLDELFSRGYIMRKWQENPTEQGFINAIQNDTLPQEIKNNILRSQKFTPAIFVPGFGRKNKNEVFKFDPNKSAFHFVHDTGGITDARLRISYMTILTSFEKVMPLIKDWSPQKEFFRHIRNAAAHNGKLGFDKKTIDKTENKLKKSAKWEDFEITLKNQNQDLFIKTKSDRLGFWSDGDFFKFLLDFENYHPEIKS